MELFKVIVSGDAKQFERLVNKAMNQGYIIAEGMQTLVVAQDPVSFQFVRHLLHREYCYHQHKAKSAEELRSNLGCVHANKDAVPQSLILKSELERKAMHERFKRED